MTLRSILFASITACLPLPAALGAQGWAVQAAAGRAVSDPVSARVGSNVASLGVEYGDSAARWLYLTAGTPLASSARRGPRESVKVGITSSEPPPPELTLSASP